MESDKQTAKPSGDVQEVYESEVKALAKSVQGQQLSEALKLVVRLLENVANNPTETKYRTVKKTNKTLQEKVFSISGIDKLFTLAGFQPDASGENLVIQTDLDVFKVYPILTPLREQTALAEARLESQEAYDKQLLIIAERKKHDAEQRAKKKLEDEIKNLMQYDKQEQKYIKARDS